jgi:predicted nicotinamide N-methyase
MAKFCEMNPHLVSGKAVVELGAGCGIVAMVCTTLGSHPTIACEHPCGVPWLLQNVALNNKAAVASVQVASWDWATDPPANVPVAPDVLLASDVTYCPKYHDIFLATVVRLMKGNPTGCVLYLFHDDASIPGNARHRSMFLQKALTELDGDPLDLSALVSIGFAEDSIHGYKFWLKKT